MNHWAGRLFFSLPGVFMGGELLASEVPRPQYNVHFFQGSEAGLVDEATLRAFLDGDSVPPGHYSVDLFVNRHRAGRQSISFERNSQSGAVEACLGLSQLAALGMDVEQLDPERRVPMASQTCPDIKALVDNYETQYNANRQQLHISFPQALVSKKARGYVAPELWDSGVTAGFIDYRVTARNSMNGGASSSSTQIGLTNGLNLGNWRLRNESAFSQQSDRSSRFASNRTYAQRDITSLKSQLTLGATYSSSQIFDSVRFKGIQLQSDEAMLPDSMRGYAPVVRGIAGSNATVEVRQNGFMIHSENVTPGPFELSDFYPSGSNGDLEVTVIEADGQKTVSVQSFASLPQMVRRGMYRYNIAAGQYDNAYDSFSPTLATVGVTYGLTDDVTVFGGVMGADGYRAENVGITRNTPIGALSTNVTRSTSNGPGGSQSGQSLKVDYAKTLASTDTTFSLAGYRFSTDGYRTMADHVADQRLSQGGSPEGRARTRVDLTVNQTLGARKNGALYFGGNEQRYWNLSGKSRQFNAGYSNNWGVLSYSVGVSHTQNQGTGQASDSQAVLSLSMPLGGSVRSHSNLMIRDSGQYSLQSGVSGALQSVHETYYSAQVGHDSAGASSGAVNLDTRTPVARVNAGYTQGRNTRAMSVGAQGSIVAHAGGINLGPSVGETFALAKAPNLRAGTRVGGHSDVTIGRNGYAVVPTVSAYRYNWISLKSQDLGADVDIEDPIQQLIPRRGAVTVATFNVTSGRRIQMELLDAQGVPLPFGSAVKDEKGQQLAVVDPSGTALIMSESDAGTIHVSQGTHGCTGTYQLPPKAPGAGYDHISIVCH